MPKVDRIVALLESRIRSGDYALRPVPAESKLAVENAVSRMTARKALLRLESQGLLSRGENGRLMASPGGGVGAAPAESAQGRARRGTRGSGAIPRAPHALIGFLAPAYGSAEIDRWRSAVERVVHRAGGRTRVVLFHHWDDPVLLEAAASFDGLFLVPPAEPVPPEVVQRLGRGRSRLVALDADLTPHGIRSVDLSPPSVIHRLLDHLGGLGHRSIHCFNAQPVDAVVEQRIEQWSLWRAAQGIGGELLNEPDKSYGDPVRHAHAAMSARLAAGPLGATAVLCITMPAAIGLMRALFERRVAVGRAVSVCAANDEGLAEFLCPSLTATRMPDPAPYLSIALDWLLGRPAVGPLLSRPAEVPLFVGESTGPAPARVV